MDRSTIGSCFGDRVWAQIACAHRSWFISPVCCGLLAAGFFGTLRHFVLRSADSLGRALHTYPLIVGFTIAVNGFYIAYYGPSLEQYLPPRWIGGLAAVGIGAVLSLL